MLSFSAPTIWWSVGLLVLVAAVFESVRHFDFIRLDDPGYVKTNPFVITGFSWTNVAWAWTTGHAANWHPITWMSHMLDAELFGAWPGGHHVTNVVFHALNTVLLFFLLRRATGATGRSVFVAALFGVHPMHVESVAWVSERKDVLSTLFWLLAMWAYVSYVRRPAWTRYLLVCLWMALGLASKPMLVTLPFALLLFDIWPLRRWPAAKGPGLGRLVMEKVPLLTLAVTSSVITVLVQRQGGAVTGLGLLPLGTRIENALVAYARYVGKSIWPTNMAVFYPYSEHLPAAWIYGSAVGLVLASIVALRLVRRHPYVPVGWFWFVGTLVPVIGIVQVGTQAIADRYTYVPYIGLFVVIAWGAVDLTARAESRRFLPAGAAIAALVCAIAAWTQVRVWKDTWTVWSHSLAVTSGNYIAHNEVGIGLVAQGRDDEAFEHFQASSRARPEYVEARNNIGLQLVKRGRVEEAIQQYTLAVRLRPEFAEAHQNLGYALMTQSRNAEAERHYRDAIRLKPDFAQAHNNLGFLLAANGKPEEAITHFEEAVRLEPDSETGHLFLAMAQGGVGRLDEAIAHAKEAVRINPTAAGPKDTLARLEALKRASRAGGGK